MKFTLNEYNKSLAMQVMRDASTLSASFVHIANPSAKAFGGGGREEEEEEEEAVSTIWVC